MFKSLTQNPPATSYEGKDEDERIKYVVRASVVTTIPWLLMTGILVALPFYLIPLLSNFQINQKTVLGSNELFVITFLWYLFTTGFFFQNLINWFFNILIISNKKIVDVDFYGFLYKNISETTLNNIEDVTSNVKGAFGVIFNIGTVFVQTAGEKSEFEFHNADNPEEIRDTISDLVAKVKRNDNN